MVFGVWCLGLEVGGLEFGVWGLGFGSGLGVGGLGFGVRENLGVGFGVRDLGCGVWSLGFGDWRWGLKPCTPPARLRQAFSPLAIVHRSFMKCVLIHKVSGNEV